MNDFASLRNLSKAELEQHLERLQQMKCERIAGLEEAVQELQVHRIELEMQNRSLGELQHELQVSVTRYAALYDRLPIGYVTVTPQGRILEANLRATLWLQCERRTVVGRHLRAFLSADEAMRVSAFLDHCAHSDEERVLDTMLNVPADSPRCLQLTGQRTSASDGAVHILLALMDITALKQSERNLQGLNAELDALGNAISHDLRAPLVSIGSFGSIVLEEYGNGLDPTAREMIERIRRVSTRLEETLKQLLDYSRLTRVPVAVQPVNLDEVVTDLLLEQRALIHYRKAEVEVQRPLAAVLGSRPILEQVLRNLLSNALKYTLPEEPPRVCISTAIHGASVVLQISDRGIGIDAKHHERLFKLFERLHPQSQYPGAGVGLAIVRRALERLGGRVWLRSDAGSGSTFFVELPVAP